MTYTGSILIVDEEGNMVYDRPLSTDQIIEELLKAPPLLISEASSVESVPPPPVKRAYKKKEKIESAPTMSMPDARGKRTKICSYCNEPGHMPKTCAKKRVDERQVESEGDPMTEDEFYKAMELKRDGYKSLETASELGVALVEMNIAYASTDYDWYIEHR